MTGAGEDDGLDVLAQERDGRVSGRQDGAGAQAQLPVDDRRIVEDEVLAALRRAVFGLVDQCERTFDQSFGVFLWVGDGRRGADELRIAAVEAAQALHAAQHVGHMAAEHAPVAVDFVHDHELQPAEQRPPGRVEGQDAGMEHVGIGDEHAAGRANRSALAARRVAIIGVHRQRQLRLGDERGRFRFLVMGQRLGREEVQGAGVGPGRQARQDRQRVAERLAAGGGCGDDDVFPPADGFDGRRLVGVELLDAAGPQGPGQARIDRIREWGKVRRPGRDAFPGDDIGDEVAVGAQVVEQGGQGRHG